MTPWERAVAKARGTPEAWWETPLVGAAVFLVWPLMLLPVLLMSARPHWRRVVVMTAAWALLGWLAYRHWGVA